MSSKRVRRSTPPRLDDLDADEVELKRLLERAELIDVISDRFSIVQNPNRFVETILIDRITKRSVKQAPIHKAIQYAFDNFKKVLVILPRGHGKTTNAYARVLLEVGRNPDILIKIIGASDNLATKRVRAIKQHIEGNKNYKQLFPKLKPGRSKIKNAIDAWGKTSIVVEREIIDPNPTVESCGILASVVGDRADVLLFDDPCNLRNTILMPALREQVIQAYDNVWLPLLDEFGRTFYIATPWHKDDLTSTLMKRWKNDPDACVLNFHVGQKLTITSEGEVLSIEETNDKFLPIWEEKFNRKALMGKMNDLLEGDILDEEMGGGSRAYDRAYRCLSISDEDIIFYRGWLDAAKDHLATFIDSIDDLRIGNLGVNK